MKNTTLSGCAAMLFGAATSLAQPAAYTDLGDRTATQQFAEAVTLLAANDVQWYRIQLPAADATQGSFVDMWTSLSGLPDNMTDTEIGIFDEFGNLIVSDDDDDAGLYSAMSFGLGVPPRPANGAGVAFNGRDGTLSGGVYWVAVARYSVAFAGGWTVTSTYTGTQRTTTLNVNIQAPGSPTSPFGVGVADPNSIAIGGSSLLTVTVTPGNNPASTGISVIADLSQIGGSSTQAFVDDGTSGDQWPNDGVYSYGFVGNGSEFPAVYQLPFTVADAESRSTTGNIALTITPPPPANDDCSGAEVVGEGSFPFDSTAASNDGQVVCVPSSRDVWFQYVPTITGAVDMETCGSSFDTVLSVHDSPCGSVLACNDDACGLQSRVTFVSVTQGTPVWVRVARWTATATQGGPGTLTIQASPSTNPVGVGNADPDLIGPGGTSLLTVEVTPGANPASTGLSVTTDLSGLGGSSTQMFFDDGSNGDQIAGDNVFSYQFTGNGSEFPGAYQLYFTVADLEGRSGFDYIDLEVSGPTNPTGVASASPDPVYDGSSTLFRITVQPGDFPPSTGVVVTADFSAFGGSGTQALLDDGTNGDEVFGDGIYSATLNVPAGTAQGVYGVNWGIGDDQGRVHGGTHNLTVLGVPSWDESIHGGGDAGDLPGSNQSPTGDGAFESIAGSLDASDVDMFLIDICDVANFSATTYGGTTVDTQLWIFGLDGIGVAVNDDVPDGFPGDATLQSRVSGQFVAGPGQYLLAISRYNRDAVDASNALLFINTPFNTERGADGPGAANPIAGWTGSTTGGATYRINLTGACFAGGGVACDADVNCDGSPDQGDVACMILAVAGDTSCICQDPDFNLDGSADQGDVASLIGVVAGQPCP